MLTHSRSALAVARLLAIVVAFSVLTACDKSAAPKPGSPGTGDGPPGGMPPPEVSVITVQASDQPVQFEYTGQTAGSRETEVRARVAGILQKRLYQEGATVSAGTPLFQIDPANFQTQLNSAEAGVSVAEARVRQARRDNSRLPQPGGLMAVKTST